MRLYYSFFLFLLLSVLTSFAQTKPSPAPGENVDVSKEGWVIEHLLTTITLEDSGRDVREVTAEIKLSAEAGVKAFAVLNFTYTSANESVDIDYVRVHKPDGSVVNTPDYNIQDMPADITRTAPLYSDIHEKHVAVKGLGVGDTLEYKIRYKTLKPEVQGQAWYAFNMTTDQIVRDERIELTVPKDKLITVKSPQFKPEIVEQGNVRLYKWKHSNLQRKDEESVAKRTTPPPDVQVSTFASWEEVGRWYSELQKNRVAITPAITAKANELTKGLTTDNEKLRAIYNFVSLRVHYIGLDFGIGRFQPHAAEDVLGNEYGDCKDKHTLLAVLLKAAGFDAWPALIHASQKLDPEVPSPGQFNHMITVVSQGQGLVWLDTTAEVAPYGLILPQLRDKQALVIPTGKPAVLMSTPANPPFPQEQRFNAVAKLGADGVLHGHISQRYHGDVEVALRALLRQIPEAKWKDAIQNLSHGMGFGGDVSNVAISPIEDLDKPLEISYDYLRKDYADWEHKQILTLLPPLGIEFAASKNQKAPTEPLYLGSVGVLVYHSEIELPPGTSLIPPYNVDIVEPFAEYHTQNGLEDGKLVTTRRLILKKTEVPVSDWEGFKKMSQAASDDSFKYLPLSGLEDSGTEGTGKDADIDTKFRKATEALQNRDAPRAQELLEQVIAVQPNYRGAHFNLGSALAGQGRLSDALEQFQKEEEVTPDNPRAYQAAGTMAAVIGKRDLAVAQFRKLLKIEPKNREGTLRLSSLLSAEGKYAESAEILEKAVELSPESATLQFSLGDAYARSGDIIKALPHLRSAADSAEKSSSIDYMQLNNIAYTLAQANTELDLAKHYIEEALAELDTRSRSEDNAGQTHLTLTRNYSFLWDTAGWVYFKLGDLKRAQSYTRAAWILAQNGIVGEHLGEIYEKLGMTKEAAHVYKLGYAAMQSVPSRMIAPVVLGTIPAETEAAQKLAKARYEKLTGQQINVNSMDRLPNGKWPTMPIVEVSELREAKLSNEPGPDGSADFEIKFAADGAPVADFLNGNTDLKSMKKRLEVAKFKVEIPVDSKAVLYRRATVHCSKFAPCSAVLMPMDVVSTVTTIK